MRGDSGFAEKNVRRSSGLLQHDTLKVINMVDLARELSGDPELRPQGPASAPATDPADYWRHQFRGAPGATPLAVTIPPQKATARRPAQLDLTLSESLSERLRAFADQIGVPFGVLFHASWALLIHRYSGEDEIVFGIVKGCIERESNDGEPGVHIVPTRVVFEPEARVRPWLRALADQAKEAAPFEFISLDHIRAAAQIPSAVPMFEAVLSVGHDSFEPLSIATVQPQASQAQAGADMYPLVAAVYLAREITLRVAYSPQKFSEAAIKLLLGHWSMLLGSMCETADEPVSSVRMLTLPEREHLLEGLNKTSAPWPSSACVHELFEQQVERTPDAGAIILGEETLPYRELNNQANALAHHLRARGIGPDSVVGICLERSFSMVVAVMAALKAGAAYLPLDPTYPHDRLRFMLEDSRAAVLLTQKSLQHVFPNVATSVFLLDEDWKPDSSGVESNPVNLARPENLSYLIYTSGSTGKPKGVAMVHRALVNLLDWQLKNSTVGAGEKTLQFTSLSFDVSFQEIFSTLCSGGTLVLISAAMRLNPRELWNFIARERIARIFLPFVALQQLADAAAAENTMAEALREVITAGEQLQVTPRLRELFARHPEATLHNHYGPSETHVVTALALNGDPSEWPALPSIGYPIQNTQIYLLDKNHDPVAQGLPGELYIGGVALARGYFERPDVTAEKFIPDPFSPAPGRLYKTGDLARYLPDGQIEFLGRIDHQVKIRGYRVELGEIEAALNKQPGVRESAVVAREQSPGQKQLVAYVVPNEPGNLNVSVLRADLKQQLPDYMVPAAFVFLERLPLTPSGKVDRKSLPAPVEAQTAAGPVHPNERPWLPIQFQLVQIWEELLGVKPVGIRDNFFEVGGHSLLAVKMMDRIEEVTGKKLPVTTLFEHATITELADLILSNDGQTSAPVIELQTQGERPPVYFLHGDIIGGGFYAREVSRLLGNDQPFYVLPPVEIPAAELSTVEEMAVQHLKDLRAHRPHGPYLLGGFCIGALVAYEMARRLHESNEEVLLVAMIDPQLPSNLLRAHYRLADKVGRRRGLSVQERTKFFIRGYKILFRLREEWNAPLREKARFLGHAIKRLLGRNGVAEPAETPTPRAPLPADDVAVIDEQDVLSKLLWMISAYTPPPYDGAVAMFLTDEQKEFTPFLPRKWRAVAPRLEVHRVPGRHLGAITTDVHLLAEKLQGCLDRLKGQ
jgi:amino acid adenylation domain-containing protein